MSAARLVPPNNGNTYDELLDEYKSKLNFSVNSNLKNKVLITEALNILSIGHTFNSDIHNKYLKYFIFKKMSALIQKQKNIREFLNFRRRTVILRTFLLWKESIQNYRRTKTLNMRVCPRFSSKTLIKYLNVWKEQTFNKEYQNIDDQDEIDELLMSFDPIIQKTIKKNIFFNGFEEGKQKVDVNLDDDCESDFSYKQIFKLKLDNLNYSLYSFEFKIQDQGWGNSGKVNIRYSVNNSKTILGFIVDRNKNDENLYYINFLTKNLPDKFTIDFFVFCPEINGWTATIESVVLNKYN